MNMFGEVLSEGRERFMGDEVAVQRFQGEDDVTVRQMGSVPLRTKNGLPGSETAQFGTKPNGQQFG